MFLAGDDLGVDQRGQQITDSSFLVMLNAADEHGDFTLPEDRWGQRWRVVLDTRAPDVPRLAPASPVSAVLPEAALANAANEGGETNNAIGDDVPRRGQRLPADRPLGRRPRACRLSV